MDGIVKNYRLFYPPDDYFAGETGPPTLICSNIMSDDEFKNLIDSIIPNIGAYYTPQSIHIVSTIICIVIPGLLNVMTYINNNEM